MSTGVPFEFADVAEVRKVVVLLCNQALALQKLARLKDGDDIRKLEDQARDAIEITNRIDKAADRR